MEHGRTLKILMLEDNEDDVALIEHALRKENLSFVKKRVDGKEEFCDAIETFAPDIVLSDHGLPSLNSLDALKICLKRAAPTPFILVTGTLSDELAIECLREGADDYILKSNLSRLPLAIWNAVKRHRIERLKHEARHALRKQNEKLSKTNTELDNFVYSVSHNLRGPLTSVLGLLNVALQINNLDDIRKMHTMMRSSVLKLDETLKQILEYSRNSRLDIEVQSIDWSRLVNECLLNLRYLDNDGRINVITYVQTPTPFFSDIRRLRIIISNILANAFIFADEKKESIICIEIISTATEANITIKDNGIGIPADRLSKVFDMFYRGSEYSRGAGLGLYISKETVSKLHGSINLNSEFGVGTTVTAIIPNHPEDNNE
jgi:signal transduction histidine kinase